MKTEKFQITLDGQTMGTTYQIKYVVPNPNIPSDFPKPEAVKADIDHLLQIVNKQMSTYLTDSEISTFNQLNLCQKPFPISYDFAKVVAEAQSIHQLTQGGLDITLGPIVNLWGFGPTARQLNPTAQELQQCLQAVGMDKFKLLKNEQQFYLMKENKDLYLDLSSIAKGFGVDKVADYLEHIGIHHYLVEIGGEIRVKGRNVVDQIWRIGIENPMQRDTHEIIIPLKDCALATSGNYKNYFEENNQHISHIIHPKTKQPTQSDIISISVLAETSMRADGIATGLYVQGVKKALDIAEKEKLAVFIIARDEQSQLYQKASTSFLESIENLPKENDK